MNEKDRKQLLIATIDQGMDAFHYDEHGQESDRQSHVTKVTPHNIYLDNVRNSWTDIAHLVHKGRMKFYHAGEAVSLTFGR